MNILVLGGSGFIGSHLVDSLVETGNKITVFDKRKNKYVKELKDVNYVYKSFDDLDSLKNVLKSIDVIYHLLSTTVPKTSDANPKLDVESNLIGTINFLELLEGLEIKKIIYVSSGGTVYGNPKYLPIDEKHSLNPIGSYGITKVAIESFIRFYSSKFNIPFLILRPSNPYGPRQNYSGLQGVISSFLYKAINKESFEIWGNGESVRDYIYIQDLIDLFILAGLSKETGEFNIGYGDGNSINDIITVINGVTKLNHKINYSSKNVFEINKVVLDISKAQNKFKWTPKVNIEEGIKKHFDWIEGYCNK